MNISERLIKIREDSGLTRTAFAEKLNISLSMISLMESGKRPVTDRTMHDICDKFNVNFEWLKDGEGYPYDDTEELIIRILRSEYKMDDLDIKIINQYIKLSPIERQVFKDYVKKIKDAD